MTTMGTGGVFVGVGVGATWTHPAIPTAMEHHTPDNTKWRTLITLALDSVSILAHTLSPKDDLAVSKGNLMAGQGQQTLVYGHVKLTSPSDEMAETKKGLRKHGGIIWTTLVWP